MTKHYDEPNYYVLTSEEEVHSHLERMVNQLRNGLQLYITVACGSNSEGLAQSIAAMIMSFVEDRIANRHLHHFHRGRVHFKFE